MSSPNTDSTALPLPANFLAAQSTIDDFFSWLRPKILMMTAVDGSVIDGETLEKALHVFAVEVIDAINYHESVRTPWSSHWTQENVQDVVEQEDIVQ
jgi:hypothetical protein